MTRRNVAAICLGLIMLMMLYIGITFGMSFAIAYLAVEMVLLNGSVGRLALLIWLVRLLMLNCGTNVNVSKHE